MHQVTYWLSYAAPMILTSGFDKGSGPIFLDQLQCSGSDQSLFDCDLGQTIGLHSCNHSMDVGIRCSGTKPSCSGVYCTNLLNRC